MQTRTLYYIFLALTLLLLGYGAYSFLRTEDQVETEIDTFEETKTLSPEMNLGYGRGRFYTPEITIKPDLAILYKYSKPLEVNQVGLKGVWFVERDRITSLSDSASLLVNFNAPKMFVEMSGSSDLPVRIEIDNRPIGEIRVEGSRDYEISGASNGKGPRTISLSIPRGIAVYSLKFTD